MMPKNSNAKKGGKTRNKKLIEAKSSKGFGVVTTKEDKPRSKEF